MKIIRKAQAKKQNAGTALSKAEIAVVSGGINPQPLPPREREI